MRNPVKVLSLGLAIAAAVLLPVTFAAQQKTLDELARDVDRAESMRAVKNLQRTYAHYSHYGLWNEMADLFAREAIFIFDEETIKGRKAIGEYLTSREGGGQQGLRSGAVHAQIIDHPVVNLSVDGESAKGRWYGFSLLCDDKGNASLQGGVFENEYVREDGKWKIRLHHFFPQYDGPYETGWHNWKGQDVGILPYHFTPDEAGIPIPAPVGTAPKTKATLAELEERLAIMNDEALVRNLQASYGYYVNRRMWDDVTDLFTSDGVYEVGGVGVYKGTAGVRKAVERMGPAGLAHGVLNDRLQFDTVVSFAPGRREAHVRGMELGLLGEADKGEGYWEVSVYDNRFEKEGGLWKVREMRVFPLFKSKYSEGWGKSRIVETAQAGTLAPNAPVPADDAGEQGRIIPAFVSAHPVTGKTVTAPQGMKLVATKPLTGAIPAASGTKASTDMSSRMKDAFRKVMVATAYDAAEHVSSSYGFFADDSQWNWLSELFGKTGTKQIPFAGYYTGYDRISHGLFLEYGDPVSLNSKKASIAFHWRIQPVINVAPDGRSARIRTYLFHPNTSKTGSGTLFGAMYPDDHLMLENGVWRLWNLSLDEPYFEMPNWKSGWSGAMDRSAAVPQRGAVAAPSQRGATPPVAATANAPARPRRFTGAALVAEFRPDVPISELGKLQEHYRGGTGEPWSWPQILPMWWGYKNPVSGRQPELFLPDCVPCEHSPDMSLLKHGYLLPTPDPVRSED